MSIEETIELEAIDIRGWSLKMEREMRLRGFSGPFRVVPKNLEQVYLIQAEGTLRYKIGISVNPVKRLRSMQTGSPVKLILVRTIPGNKDVEAAIHKDLERYRVHREWFEFNHPYTPQNTFARYDSDWVLGPYAITAMERLIEQLQQKV